MTTAAPAAGPLTPEEIADRIVPGEPRISPDGRSVAFSAAPAGRAGEHDARALWLSRDGAPARKLTAGEFDDRLPRWSPDGTRLLFVSDRPKRGEESGLYLLPLDGGEATRLGDVAGELSEPAWSPDGATVTVLRTDPKPDDQKKKEEAKDDAVIVEGAPRFGRLWTVDLATGRARCLTTAARSIRSYAWLPDGSGLVAVATSRPECNAICRPADLWLVPAAGGRARKIATFPLTPREPAVVGQAVALPAEGGRDDPATAVWLVDLAGGTPRNLLPGWDGEVYQVAAGGDGTDPVVFNAVQDVHGNLYRLTTGGEPIRCSPAPAGDRGSVDAGFTLSRDGKRVAFVWSHGTTPEEVYIGDLGGEATAVSSFGASFAGRLQPVERVCWTSDDGVEVHGLLTLPAGYEPGRRFPLVVEVHGGPSWQWEERIMLDWHDWAQLLASHGFAVLQPNPRGSTGRGAAFARLLQDDVGGGESRDLVAGARAMVERGIADPERLGIGGWSWGGYLTAMTTTQTTLFRAAVMGAGLANVVSDHGMGDIPACNLLYFPGEPYHHMDAYWRASPIRQAANVTTPTLILHGDADARVHPAQGMEWYRALKTLAVPVEFVRYPREEHPIKERAHQLDLMRRVVAWYRRWLMG